jgi:hypothetical protein
LHQYQQQRGLKWAFWREGAVETPPETPPLDPEFIDQIVAIAGPQAMDAATWALISHGSFPLAWAGQHVLRGMHETLGLPWMAVIPITVLLVRTSLVPIFIYSQKASVKLVRCQNSIRMVQQDFQNELQQGLPPKQAHVSFTFTCKYSRNLRLYEYVFDRSVYQKKL